MCIKQALEFADAFPTNHAVCKDIITAKLLINEIVSWAGDNGIELTESATVSGVSIAKAHNPLPDLVVRVSQDGVKLYWRKKGTDEFDIESARLSWRKLRQGVAILIQNI